MQQHNPYQNATNAYSNNKAASYADPRTLEAQALLKAASRLDELRTKMRNGNKIPLEEMSGHLDYNRKLWTVFADNAADDNTDMPLEVRNNIANLAVFVFKRTMNFMAENEADKLDAIIDINRQLASGLMKAPAKTPAEGTETAGGYQNQNPAVENKVASYDI